MSKIKIPEEINYKRRRLCGVAAVTVAAARFDMFGSADAPSNNVSPAQQPMTANGGTDPYPIPWLDKFGSHNQAAGPNNEPSHIYHFKGRVLRCNAFTGMGTDNQGNRIAFGAPSTDYGVMQGEYWAARAPQHGTFVHI